MGKVEFEPYILTDEVDIYAIKSVGEKETEISKFYNKFINSSDNYLRDDLARIIKILEKISNNGAKESYFRRDINNHGTLRLYCLRISNQLLILGSGDLKSSRTYEEDSNLNQMVDMLQSVDRSLMNLGANGTDLRKEIVNLVLDI